MELTVGDGPITILPIAAASQPLYPVQQSWPCLWCSNRGRAVQSSARTWSTCLNSDLMHRDFMSGAIDRIAFFICCTSYQLHQPSAHSSSVAPAISSAHSLRTHGTRASAVPMSRCLCPCCEPLPHRKRSDRLRRCRTYRRLPG